MVKRKRSKTVRKDVAFLVTKKGKVHVFSQPKKKKRSKRKKRSTAVGAVWKRWRQRK